MTVKPLVEAFFAWVKKVGGSNRLPKGKTLEGFNYYIYQEEPLKMFLNDGEVPLDVSDFMSCHQIAHIS